MRTAFVWGALAGAVILSAPSAASAEDSAAEREALARFDEGVARVKSGNIEGARVSFTQAYAVIHKLTILWNLALAEEKTRHLLDALAHFKELTRQGQSADDRASAEKHLGDLMAQTGHLDVGAPAGDQLLVDGILAATAPLSEPLDVLPGRHHLEARAPLGSKESDVEVAAGQIVHVSLLPTNEPRPATASVGQAPGGATATTATARQPAPHRGSAEHEGNGGRSVPRVITVAFLGTASAVLVSVGAYFALQSQRDQTTVEGFRRSNASWSCYSPTSDTGSVTCAAWNDAVRAQSNDATLSNVLYITGGVLGAGALASWFLWPRDTSDDGPPLGLMPTLGPVGAGLRASGRF